MKLKDRYEAYRTFRMCFSNPTEELIEKMEDGSLLESMQNITEKTNHVRNHKTSPFTD